MEEQAVNNQVQQAPVKPASTKPNYWMIAIIVIIFLFILGGVYTLALRSQKQISSKPQPTVSPLPISPTSSSTTDETANWKTYRNSQFNFLFKYPDQLYEVEVSIRDPKLANEVYSVGLALKESEACCDIVITVLNSDLNSAINEVNSIDRNFFTIKQEEANFAGIPGIRIDHINKKSGHTFTNILVSNRGYIYYVDLEKETDPERLKIFDQILSTFKFLDKEDQTVCTQEAKLCPDGKTYVGRQGPNCEFAPCP